MFVLRDLSPSVHYTCGYPLLRRYGAVYYMVPEKKLSFHCQYIRGPIYFWLRDWSSLFTSDGPVPFRSPSSISRLVSPVCRGLLYPASCGDAYRLLSPSFHYHYTSYNDRPCTIYCGGGSTWISSSIILPPAQKLRCYLRLRDILSYCESGAEEGPAAPAYLGHRADVE